MHWKTFLRQKAWALLFALVICVLLWLVSLPPHYQTYVLLQWIDRLLVLLLGAGRWLSDFLLTKHPLLLSVFFLLLVALFAYGRELWKAKRWPALIVIVILIVGNWLFVGAFRFVLAPSIGTVMRSCDEYIFDEDTVLRIIRYPVDINLEYGEQQFLLVSNDEGITWRQVFQAYGVSPLFTGCDNIHRNGQDGLQVAFERKIATELNEWVIVESSDRGRTWQVSIND